MLSTARINSRLAPGIKESPLAELVAVASRKLSRAEKAAGKLGAEKAFGSYEELLKSDEIDAVYVSLPNSLHAEWTVQAAEAGKHVLCEKPLASDSGEAERVVKACERAGVLLMEALMYRHHPQQAEVREIIESGRIGKPVFMDVRFTDYREPSEAICWKGGLSGGALMHMGCYCVDASRFIFDSEPTSAKTMWRFDEERGVDVTTHALLEFPGDRHAFIACSLMLHRSNRYEVMGTEGSIELPASFRPGRADAIIKVKDGEGTEEIVVPGVDQYMLEVEHFSRCILEGTPLRYPAENGLANMKAIDRVRKGVDN